MDKTKILPLVMILIDVGSAAVCASAHDWRRCVYWIAAAILNVTVTF